MTRPVPAPLVLIWLPWKKALVVVGVSVWTPPKTATPAAAPPVRLMKLPKIWVPCVPGSRRMPVTPGLGSEKVLFWKLTNVGPTWLTSTRGPPVAVPGAAIKALSRTTSGTATPAAAW